MMRNGCAFLSSVFFVYFVLYFGPDVFGLDCFLSHQTRVLSELVFGRKSYEFKGESRREIGELADSGRLLIHAERDETLLVCFVGLQRFAVSRELPGCCYSVLVECALESEIGSFRNDQVIQWTGFSGLRYQEVFNQAKCSQICIIFYRDFCIFLRCKHCCFPFTLPRLSNEFMYGDTIVDTNLGIGA